MEPIGSFNRYAGFFEFKTTAMKMRTLDAQTATFLLIFVIE